MWMWWNLCMWFGVGADAARSKQAAAVSGHSRAGARQLLGGSDQHTQGGDVAEVLHPAFLPNTAGSSHVSGTDKGSLRQVKGLRTPTTRSRTFATP